MGPSPGQIIWDFLHGLPDEIRPIVFTRLMKVYFSTLPPDPDVAIGSLLFDQESSIGFAGAAVLMAGAIDYVLQEGAPSGEDRPLRRG